MARIFISVQYPVRSRLIDIVEKIRCVQYNGFILDKSMGRIGMATTQFSHQHMLHADNLGR